MKKLFILLSLLLSFGQIEAQTPSIRLNYFFLGTASVTMPANSVVPTLSTSGGSHTVGVVITSSTGTWTGSPVFTYQWQRDGVNIGGQTASTYTSTSSDINYGVNITCVVTATNAAGSVSVSTANFGVVCDPSTEFTRYWRPDASNSFKDASAVSAAASGQGILRVNSIAGTANMTGTITSTGKVQKLNDTYYADWKTAVATVATSNVTLSGEQTINGVTTSASRILVAGNTSPPENGIYVTAAGAWSRATDANTSFLMQDMVVQVSGGTQANKIYNQTNKGTFASPYVLGTSSSTITDITASGYHLDPNPEWRSEDGGFFHIRNTRAQQLATNGITGLNATAAFALYYYQFTGGTDNEYFFFRSNGPAVRDRDAGTGNTTQVGQWNNLLSLTTGGRIALTIPGKKGVMGVVRDGSGNVQLMWDLANWGENIAGVGVSNWTDLGTGSNNHASNGNFYAMAVISGAYDATKSGRFKKLCEFNNGNTNTPSRDYPSVTFWNGGTFSDQETWNSTDKSINIPTYTFYSPTGLSEGATELRLYTSNVATQDPAVEQRTYVEGSLQIKGVTSGFGKFIRNTNFGTSGAPTSTKSNLWYWVEVIAVDSGGGRQKIETQTQGFLDNQN